jgi:hypothetical protein
MHWKWVLAVNSPDAVTMFVVFNVCKSMHHHTIQISHHIDATVSPVYYPDVYLQLNTFWAS